MNHLNPHQFDIMIGEIGEESTSGEVRAGGDAIVGGEFMNVRESLRSSILDSESKTSTLLNLDTISSKYK